MHKRNILILFAVLGTALMSAQTNEKAIGVRFGTGGEITYQHPLSETNRLELDLGSTSHSLGITGIYHWVNDLSNWTEGMYWYLGPGAAVGFSNTIPSGTTSRFMLGVAGQIGLEYKFEFPLQLTLDYRPVYYIIQPKGAGGSYGDICLSARYRF